MTEVREMIKRNLERELNKVIENYIKIYDEYYETGSRDSAFLKDLADAIIGISAREEVCNRLESNWNKLKEIAKSQSGFKKRADLKGGLWFEIDDLLDKMQELERSDNQ